MAINGESIKGKSYGLLSGPEGSAAEKTRAAQVVVGRQLHCNMPGATTANTDASFHLISRLPYAIRVSAAHLAPALAASVQASAAADGWAFTLKYDDGAGGASTSIASFNTTSAALVFGTTRAMTVTAPVDVPAGSRLFVLCDATNTAATANAVALSFSITCEET
jgi:hypothetical protein